MTINPEFYTSSINAKDAEVIFSSLTMPNVFFMVKREIHHQVLVKRLPSGGVKIHVMHGVRYFHKSKTMKTKEYVRQKLTENDINKIETLIKEMNK